MWKQPNRPPNSVSQQFNSGIVKIFAVSDSANPGRKPVESLSLLITLRYEEQRVGIQRFYEAKQNQVSIERVLRVYHSPLISSQCVAVTEDGEQYRIEMVQTVSNAYPACVDITLTKVEQKYEV